MSSVPPTMQAKHDQVAQQVADELAKWRTLTGFDWTWEINYPNFVKSCDSFYHADVPVNTLTFLRECRSAAERLFQEPLLKDTFLAALHTRKIVGDVDTKLRYARCTAIKNGVLTIYTSPDFGSSGMATTGHDLKENLRRMEPPQAAQPSGGSTTWQNAWENPSVPPIERSQFLRLEPEFKAYFRELDELLSTGPWGLGGDLASFVTSQQRRVRER